MESIITDLQERMSRLEAQAASEQSRRPGIDSIVLFAIDDLTQAAHEVVTAYGEGREIDIDLLSVQKSTEIVRGWLALHAAAGS